MSNGHEDRAWTLGQAQRSYNMDHEDFIQIVGRILLWFPVEFSCELHNSCSLLDISPMRFIACASIGHWSGCYNGRTRCPTLRLSSTGPSLLLIHPRWRAAHSKSRRIYSWAISLRRSTSQAEKAQSVRCTVVTGVFWSYHLL